MKEEQSFTPGEVVEIIRGPFTKATGKVREVNNDKQKLVVTIKEGPVARAFGDVPIPVELRFREVKKIVS